ncbi:AraC family ligand binding domain-containing protein [Paenibacillus sacheonensis]|uniref:AraC-type arabinose-binding/dimerisation domain-containing protein n=1 Tax=Paenibacillus sacheonensis TaxID=742054 RepID=A0A7X5C007_9BACL|nr:AraC family ligand binding domain-containing protein [Paenibacillus sacheonensis]NBC71252.1 hypothetical protein [Paenibacillus sacheonensis]
MDTMNEVLLMPRLTKLDVKWSSELQGNEHFAQLKSNPHFELIMVTEGPVYLQAGGREIELQSGECYLLLPWEPYAGYRPIPASAGFYWVQFTADPPLRPQESSPGTALKPNRPQLTAQELRTAKDTGAADDALLLPRRFKPRNRYELLRLFELMNAQLVEPRGYYRYRCLLLLGQMLELLASGLMERELPAGGLSPTFLPYRRIVNQLEPPCGPSIRKPHRLRYILRKSRNDFGNR